MRKLDHGIVSRNDEEMEQIVVADDGFVGIVEDAGVYCLSRGGRAHRHFDLDLSDSRFHVHAHKSQKFAFVGAQ